jgi:hypothetical protein
VQEKGERREAEPRGEDERREERGERREAGR